MSRGEVLEQLAQLRSAMDVTIVSVADGAASVADVLAAGRHDAAVGYLYAVKVLEADPRVGKVRARRILDDLGLGETTRIRELSSAQASSIVAEVA
ncbi:MAG: hypothetical protein RLZZ254_582 [Actinomycetota bacterium]|jgi:hypothetical protein